MSFHATSTSTKELLFILHFVLVSYHDPVPPALFTWNVYMLRKHVYKGGTSTWSARLKHITAPIAGLTCKRRPMFTPQRIIDYTLITSKFYSTPFHKLPDKWPSLILLTEIKWTTWVRANYVMKLILNSLELCFVQLQLILILFYENVAWLGVHCGHCWSWVAPSSSIRISSVKMWILSRLSNHLH